MTQKLSLILLMLCVVAMASITGCADENGLKQGAIVGWRESITPECLTSWNDIDIEYYQYYSTVWDCSDAFLHEFSKPDTELFYFSEYSLLPDGKIKVPYRLDEYELRSTGFAVAHFWLPIDRPTYLYGLDAIRLVDSHHIKETPDVESIFKRYNIDLAHFIETNELRTIG